MAVTESDWVEALAARLIADGAGGYLRNTLRPSLMTCDNCDCPIDLSWSTCFKCGQIYGNSPLAADQVASMIYAVRGRQSGYIMLGYKSKPRVEELLVIVGSLAWIGQPS